MKLELLLLLSVAAAAPAGAQKTAEALFSRLSLEQKAGQLFMSWTLAREAGAGTRLRVWVRELGLGGVILSTGSAKSASALIQDLQKISTVPLLIAGDFETGLAFRLRGTTDLGSNMLVSASGLPWLAREQGRITAEEGRALGFHWAFAPVVDVNVNPSNPIINVRSYGEDPARVAAFTRAFVHGIEGAGMLATAKHFPGHGDVATDSHLAMPTVPGDRARLERVELRPFRAAIGSGVSSIMTGHLAVPGLGEDPAVPATLSRKVLTGVLRDELGFDGLIVTDALNMGGVKNALSGGEVAVQALLAGADVLLMPPDPVQARDAIVAAVESGRVTRQRLDRSVRRILRAKERVGLLAGLGLPDRAGAARVLRSAAHLRLAAEIARRGVTLVRDRDGLVPAPAADEPGRLLVTILDRPDPGRGQAFHDALQDGRPLAWRRIDPKAETQAIAAAAQAISATPGEVIVALHQKVRSYSGRIGLPARLAPLVSALRARRRVVVVSFGNPYLLSSMPEISTYLCAYNEGVFTEQAVARALLGKTAITGRLPVSIPPLAMVGGGLTVLPAAQGLHLPRAEPRSEGLDAGLGASIDMLLRQAIAEHAFPGAVAMVARRGRVLASVAIGKATYASGARSITPDSLFDLASLTKVCATLPAVLRLVASKKLSLDTRVGELLPAFRGVGTESVTIRHLLAHAGGLSGYVRFFRSLRGKDAILEAAAREGLMAEPGTRTIYSDLGFMLLMACVEKVSGEPFDRFVEREVCKPLGMRKARFIHPGEQVQTVPTEVDPWRGRLVRGEVHDENAYAMGGVSGHAGLFATAEDVMRIGLAFLGGGRGLLPAPLVRLSTRPAGLVPGSSRALGWDMFRKGGSGGSRLSSRAFGHTGFTGTSIWCDPKTDLCIVLLTNRVHPTRVNGKIAAVRAALADLVAESLVD